MSDIYPDDPDAERYQIFLHNYLHLVGMTILYYDYALTFGDEYTRIWRQQATRAPRNYLFFMNRYLTLLGDVAVNVGNFYDFKTTHSCSQYAFYRQALLIGAQVVVCFILYLRTSALYNGNKFVRSLILIVGLSLAGLSIYAVIGQHESISVNGGCHAAADRITAIRIAVAWESLFVFDCMIFSLTMWKTWKQRSLYLVPADKLDLVSLISRDGAMYFAVMASVNLSNTLTFYFLQPLLRGVLSTFASSVSVTMMSRLMLNLHESAGISSSTITNLSTDNSSTLLFTSGIGIQEGDILTMSIARDVSPYNHRDTEEGTITDDVLPVDQPEEIEMVPQDYRRRRSTARTGSDC
ncbi:uncharacterized protein C8Q71DRAFT_783117 [Rhodofomes roseus]|uniref:DUF6533 domain-containing protein n=1 Tax=Rhodofomes roseus TaxID=34475 RepID=A0ABQ8K3Z8_9APHY|nr:uncharacterized protein C8Q71DRAFT_783117 [Rhodofomes roseus]KAH9831175.1 hypothetical protein C8Q71DRAFT_783117 [Rhodofomes roseus]